jgi:hypothetical protein
MSSDESFFDENLDKSSPIRPSDRILRSSLISSESDRTILTDFNQKIHSFVSTNKETISETKNSSRTFQKIRLSIER